MEQHVQENLRITAVESGSKMCIRFEGRSNARKPEKQLTAFFDNLFTKSFDTLTVEFMNLEFINSPTIPPLIRFINQLEARKINSEFVYDESINWQVVTFGVIQKLIRGKGVKSVIVRPATAN